MVVTATGIETLTNVPREIDDVRLPLSHQDTDLSFLQLHCCSACRAMSGLLHSACCDTCSHVCLAGVRTLGTALPWCAGQTSPITNCHVPRGCAGGACHGGRRLADSLRAPGEHG